MMDRNDKIDAIGRIVYFSLTNLLVKKEDLDRLCGKYGIVSRSGRRIALSDAFRSATSSIGERVEVVLEEKVCSGRVFFRENYRTKSGISKELILEIRAGDGNRYVRLARVSLNTKTQVLCVDELAEDVPVDATLFCRIAQERFERFKRCAGRKPIETICTNYLYENRATKLGVNAHIYFLPRTSGDTAERFVRFVRALGQYNEYGTPLVVNSFPLLREEEQCEQMAEEFCASLEKEIEEHRDRVEYLLSTDCPSPSVMDRWVHKIWELELKRMDYEKVLGRHLLKVEPEFKELENLSKELRGRADMIRFKRGA